MICRSKENSIWTVDFRLQIRPKVLCVWLQCHHDLDLIAAMKSRLADSTSWLASLAGYFSWFSSKDGYNVGLFRDIVVVCADGSPYQSASACLFGVDLFYSWVGGNSPKWFSLCMLKREPWEIVEYWFYINGFSRTRELSWHPIELIWFDNPVLALFSCLHMRPVSYFSLFTNLWLWCRVQKFSENFYIIFNIDFSILHVATFRILIQIDYVNCLMFGTFSCTFFKADEEML
jgi:hypothetical protein